MKRTFLALTLALVTVSVSLAATASPSPVVTSIAVVDRAGRPVPGASVRDATLPAPGGPVATTDSDGRVTPPAAARVVIEAPGFLPWEGAPEPAVTLVRPSTIAVQVLDAETGLPIAGASVRVHLAPPKPSVATGGEPASEALASALTGRDGRASAGGLHAAAHRVRVEAPGHVGKWTRAAPGLEATDRLTVDLARAVVVEGRVSDGTKPVAGASVRLVWPRRSEDSARRAASDMRGEGLGPREIVTDAAGKFRHDQVPAPARVPALFVAIGPDGRWGLASVPIILASAREPGVKPATAHVDLSAQASVSGRVTTSSGEPAAGVRVVAEVPVEWEAPGGAAHVTFGASLDEVFENLGGGPETTTGADGTFLMTGLPVATWRLVARPLARAASAPVTVDMSLDSAAPVVLVLPAGESVTGVVVDGGGTPVASARVAAEAMRSGAERLRGPQVVETLAGRDGIFVLAGVPPGPIQLTVTADGFARKHLEAAGGKDIRVVLSPSGSLTGRVLSGRTGDPIPRFTVSAVADDPAEAELPRWRERREAADARQTDDGTFEVGGLAPGRFTVTVRAEGYLSRTTQDVDVSAGAPTPLGDIALSSGATVRGRVVDLDTRSPVVGATVELDAVSAASVAGVGPRGQRRRLLGLAGKSAEDQRAVTDVDGRFTLTGLPSGDLVVVATHAAYPRRAASTARVALPEESSEAEVEIGLESGGSVRVRVQDATGSPVGGSWIEVRSGKSGERSMPIAGPSEAGADGTVVFEAVPPGPVTVRQRDRIDSAVEAVVRKGEVVEVVLREGGTRVSGRVLVGDTPVPALVLLVADGWRSPVSDFATTYALAGVPAGTWDLVVQAREPRSDGSDFLRRERASLTVEPGVRELVHDVVLTPTDFGDDVIVAGEVKDADTGEGLSGWVVSARLERPTGDWKAPPIARSAEGRFEVTLPGDGVYELSARPGGAEAAAYTPGPAARVEIESGLLRSGPPVLTATRRLQVRVRVIDGTGRPVGGATCLLLSKERHLGQTGLRVPRMTPVTDPAGRATATSEDPGARDLLVVAPGRAFAILPRVEVPTASEVVVELQATGALRAEGVSVIDVVELQSGNGWWFRVGPAMDFNGLGSSNADAVEVHGLPPGLYRVTSGERSEQVAIEPGATADVTFPSRSGG